MRKIKVLQRPLRVQRTRGAVEETFVAGERATIRWRYWMADGNSIRGVNLMRVEDGLIVEAMGYVKS